jgi:hypothetical protein
MVSVSCQKEVLQNKCKVSKEKGKPLIKTVSTFSVFANPPEEDSLLHLPLSSEKGDPH